jgi:glycyl-tRNA synthetase beta subunit
MMKRAKKHYEVTFKRKSTTYRMWLLPTTFVDAENEKKAISEALVKLTKEGWNLVNEEALVEEVERVYETRYDCMAGPERVRQAA